MTGRGPIAPSRPPVRVGVAPTRSSRLFRSLRIHLAILLAGLFLVFYLVTAILIYGLTAQLTQSNVDAILRDTTRPLAARVLTDLDHGMFPSEFVTLAKLAAMYPKVSAIVLRDAQGNVIASTAPLVTRSLPYQSAGSAEMLATDQVGSHGWYRVLSLRLQNPYRQTIGYLQMALNVDRDRASLARLAEVLFLVGGLGIVLAAVAGFFLSKLSLRPAVRAWEQQEQFVADASHELRTPIAVMRVNLDLVNSRPDVTVADNAPWLQAIEDELHRMHRLTDQMLTLARTGGVAAAAHHQPVDLSHLVNKAGEAFQPAAEAKGLLLHHRSPAAGAPPLGEIIVLGDADALYQLLAILLDNAVKYTVAGRIDVDLERHRHEVRLSVRDTGIGIEPQHIGRVFDRFYRTDAARTKGSGGAGLGLAIARAIVVAHRGHIAVQSTAGHGTTFIVTLPVAARIT